MSSGVPRVPDAREWVLTKRCPKCAEVKPWAKFSPGGYWEDGSVRRVQSWCCACKVDHDRSRPKTPASPERLIQLRDWKRRKRAALRAEKVPGCDVLLDPVPFREWLERSAAEVEGWRPLAELCGVYPRTLYRVMVGECERVSLALVDRCMVAMGEHFNDLYDLSDAA